MMMVARDKICRFLKWTARKKRRVKMKVIVEKKTVMVMDSGTSTLLNLGVSIVVA
jgi:hypothetical protein